MKTAAFLLAWALPVTALADAAVTQPVSHPDFEFGVEAIRAKDWGKAIEHFSAYARIDPVNADAQNFLGFAYRNQKQYDLAFRHYNEALRLDPSHKGAHEYIGEAYLMVGNKEKAQEHLLALERICAKRCDEYRDLAKAISVAK